MTVRERHHNAAEHRKELAQAINSPTTGTWTPVYSTTGTDFDSITHDVQDGYYLLVGNLLHAWWQLRTSAVTVGSATGSVQITGLPYSNINGITVPATIHGWAFSGLDGTYNTERAVMAAVSGSGNGIFLYSHDRTQIPASAMATGSNGNQTRGHICYPVTL